MSLMARPTLWLRPFLLSGLLATACVLPGCASLQAPSVANTAAGSAVQDYDGRFAVRYEQNGEIKNAYGNFAWRQRGDAVTLQLLNPLGQTQAIVYSTPGEAKLELPNRAPLTGPRLEQVMRDALGFALPVAGLRYWLQLEAAPNTHGTLTRDPQTGRITQLQQDGWTIDYLSYTDTQPAHIKRVNLSREVNGEPLQVKLVLDN
ncbi:outer membrane lipoprotein LolB [Pandoraea thiooxydans]|uniref:Outer-membrane lipoprotein LolB n=2 Tax=Pandoraea thiooxydans TaxID=445709 RepID=A0A0G3EUG5_9BURK|nr:outer membrane lipoprotein LolB [Pandoraea thiooxydans]